jgi:hypothetical protein
MGGKHVFHGVAMNVDGNFYESRRGVRDPFVAVDASCLPRAPAA